MSNSPRPRAKLVLTSLIITAAATPAAYAHHSMAIYDASKTVTIDGIVTKYEWANPHVYIYVEQAQADGKKIEWEIEGFPPGIMRRQGWSKDTLRAGDMVTISGNPTKNANANGLFPNLIKRGDSTLYATQDMMKHLLNAGPVAKDRANSLNGTWVTLPALQLIQQSVKADLSKLTAEGAAAVKRFDERTSPVAKCVAYPSPTFMYVPDIKQITVRNDAIVIGGEFDGAQRTIHLNVPTHDGAIPSIQGHSIGKWDDKSLIIDTTHFAYHSLGNGAAIPSGHKKHLVERLTPNADAKSLTYHFELTDPDYLAVPMTGDVQWVYRPDLRFAPETCDMENAGRFTKD